MVTGTTIGTNMMSLGAVLAAVENERHRNKYDEDSSHHKGDRHGSYRSKYDDHRKHERSRYDHHYDKERRYDGEESMDVSSDTHHPVENWSKRSGRNEYDRPGRRRHSSPPERELDKSVPPPEKEAPLPLMGTDVISSEEDDILGARSASPPSPHRTASQVSAITFDLYFFHYRELFNPMLHCLCYSHYYYYYAED